LTNINKHADQRVRVRYSVIVNYISQLYRLFVSFMFVVLVTRKLSVFDYGVLNTVQGINGVLVAFYGLWSYWVVRYYARGRRDLVSSAYGMMLVYAPVAFIIMVSLGLLYSSAINIPLSVFVWGALIVVSTSVLAYLRSLASGSKPFIIGKTVIVGETTRLVFAYIAVVLLRMSVDGVLLSILIMVVVEIVVYLLMFNYYGVEVPRPRFNKSLQLRLLKNSYIPLTNILSTMLSQVERPLLTAVTRSTYATAYLGVSYIPRSVVLQGSQAFTSGLGAQLLRKPSRADIEDVLRINFIVNVFLTILLVVMAKPLISLFNPQYMVVWPLFVLFTLESFIISLYSLFSTVAVSVEAKDMYEYGLKLVETPLFKLGFARLVRNIASITIGTTGVFVCLYVFRINDPYLLASFYPISWFLTGVPLLLYGYRQAINKFKFRIPWREVFASVIGSVSSSIYLFVVGATNIYVESFWRDVPILGYHVLVAVLIYGVALYLLSPWLRRFIRMGLRHYLGRSY